MACGTNFNFQQPIAYYFIRTLKSPARVEIVKEVISELTKRGIKVSNITFDGYKANMCMTRMLGATIDDKNQNYISQFPNPIDGKNVYVIFDPSHAIKLLRNTLGSLKVIYHSDGNIEWKYFEKLVELSCSKSFGLTHKMNKRHLMWKDRQMHVRTAVETLSSSTAKAMQYLQDNAHSDFVDATTTIKFVTIADTLWDIMNSHCKKNHHPNIYKSPLNPENANEAFIFLEEAKQFFLSLKVRSRRTGLIVPIMLSDNRAGFRGFVIDIVSITAMYREFVEQNHWLRCLATYRLSQDHLEKLFCQIRTLNGFNDNPMPPQFISAYRKLMFQLDVFISNDANINNALTSNVLNVSSAANKSEHFTASQTENDDWYDNFEILNYDDGSQGSGIIFIANSLENRLKFCKEIHCENCLRILNTSEMENHV